MRCFDLHTFLQPAFETPTTVTEVPDPFDRVQAYGDRDTTLALAQERDDRGISLRTVELARWDRHGNIRVEVMQVPPRPATHPH
ncbi:hypothetical protein EFY87_06400 [Flexivirga caeni]|uniref:Uncharacterized protein n=1 Tax=Flexivirga caeni TaxID=2294115 RepID=A0A3M9MFC4_9MICO|nr:hypothetical protein EFY87_06400 [Flexivirga caeni]